MADTRGDRVGRSVGVCNERCGCPYPCPGGVSCRCGANAATSGGAGDVEHMKCSCGEHCGCNPCTCATYKATTIVGVGKLHCKCGEACVCEVCVREQ